MWTLHFPRVTQGIWYYHVIKCLILEESLRKQHIWRERWTLQNGWCYSIVMKHWLNIFLIPKTSQKSFKPFESSCFLNKATCALVKQYKDLYVHHSLFSRSGRPSGSVWLKRTLNWNSLTHYYSSCVWAVVLESLASLSERCHSWSTSRMRCNCS